MLSLILVWRPRSVNFSKSYMEWMSDSSNKHRAAFESAISSGIQTHYECIGDDTKGAARRSPDCMRKTKYVLRNAGVCFIAEILRKTASPRKISLKLDNRLLSYGKKTFSIWRPSAVLNFKNVRIGHVTVVEFQTCFCVSNFTKIGWFFVGDFMICIMAVVRHLGFSNLRLYVMRPLCCAIQLPLQISLKSDDCQMTIGCRVMAKKKRFLKRRPSAMLIFTNVHIWSSVHEFQICCCVPNFIKI